MSNAKGLTRDDVLRLFWAAFLSSKVTREGQVPGYDRWWGNALPNARVRGHAYAESCWRKVDRDGRDPDEVVRAGVNAFRGELHATAEVSIAQTRSDPEYAAFRQDILRQILADGLRPFEVAALLEAALGRFPGIDWPEIDELRAWDKTWGGEIPEGTMIWNRATGKLEPWPHATQDQPAVAPSGRSGPGMDVARRVGEIDDPGASLAVSSSDDVPPPAE